MTDRNAGSGRPGLTQARKLWLASLSTLVKAGHVEVALFHNSREYVSITTVEQPGLWSRDDGPRVRVLDRHQRCRTGEPPLMLLEAITKSGDVVPRGRGATPYGWIEPLTPEVRLLVQRRDVCRAIFETMGTLARDYQLPAALEGFDDETLGGLRYLLERIDEARRKRATP